MMLEKKEGCSSSLEKMDQIEADRRGDGKKEGADGEVGAVRNERDHRVVPGRHEGGGDRIEQC